MKGNVRAEAWPDDEPAPADEEPPATLLGAEGESVEDVDVVVVPDGVVVLEVVVLVVDAEVEELAPPPL